VKVVALAVLTVLIALPAEAVQRQNNFSPSCNNDARCTTFNRQQRARHQACAGTTSAHQSVNRTTSSMPMATACW
jgi:hypothetical protein